MLHAAGVAHEIGSSARGTLRLSALAAATTSLQRRAMQSAHSAWQPPAAPSRPVQQNISAHTCRTSQAQLTSWCLPCCAQHGMQGNFNKPLFVTPALLLSQP